MPDLRKLALAADSEDLEGESWHGITGSYHWLQFVNAASPKNVLALLGELDAARAALGKINEIRNSIVGMQTLNWSEHIYPLVAALNEAGVKGMPYPEGREHFGTMLERTLAAEAERGALKVDAERYRHIRHHVHGENYGLTSQTFVFDWPTPLANIMRGSVAEHLDAAIDAARKEDEK